jgi:hypothetical protein
MYYCDQGCGLESDLIEFDTKINKENTSLFEGTVYFKLPVPVQ